MTRCPPGPWALRCASASARLGHGVVQKRWQRVCGVHAAKPSSRGHIGRFSACNDGAAIVLRDFEFFEVVFLNYCSSLPGFQSRPITGTNICAAAFGGWTRRARNLGSRLEKQAEMVAQNMHKAAQQEDEHGRKLTGRVEEFIYQILIMLGLFTS